MKRFIGALFFSFAIYLPLVVSCSTLALLAMFPIVGRPLAAPSCNGIVEVEESTYTIPGRTSVDYHYSCVAEDGSVTSISMTPIMIKVAIYIAIFITVVIWPLIFLLKYKLGGLGGRSSGRHIYVNGVPLNDLIAQAKEQQNN